MIRSPHARLEDQLGPHEPPYKSRGEAQVGRLLDRYGIPFVYERPTIVHDRGRRYVLFPDFTLYPCPGPVIEYAGMPDRPDYMAHQRFKLRAYAANHIPALFIYPSDLRGRSWPQRLYDRIRRLPPAGNPRIRYRR